MSVDLSDLMKQGVGLIEELTGDQTVGAAESAETIEPESPISGAPVTPISGTPVTPISGLPVTPISGLPVTPISGLPVRPISGAPVKPISGAPIIEAPVSERVATEAERVVANVRDTRYQHDEYIDEATGTYDTDCSGFVSYVLSRVAKKHLDLIPKETWWPVPRAYLYYRFFAAASTAGAHGWQRIEKLEDARRGDIIAWELSDEIRKDQDTGHVFVITDTPAAVVGDEKGGDLMAVKACDSAVLRHYDDSRVGADGVFNTGVGKGTFHLRVDESGAPVAFQFGPGDNFHVKPIAIGRIIPG